MKEDRRPHDLVEVFRGKASLFVIITERLKELEIDFVISDDIENAFLASFNGIIWVKYSDFEYASTVISRLKTDIDTEFIE